LWFRVQYIDALTDFKKGTANLLFKVVVRNASNQSKTVLFNIHINRKYNTNTKSSIDDPQGYTVLQE
jgi:hypothetical protein